MNLKWYIFCLILVLTFLGVGQHQISIPNQEIVVQFDDGVSKDETQIAISRVKRHLQDLGADNIIANEDGNGKLIISYFSTLEVSRIKLILSEEIELESGIVKGQQESGSKFPTEDNQNKYRFDIYEIHKEFQSDWDFTGTSILELKPDGNRFSKPKVYTSKNRIELQEINSKGTLKKHNRIAIASDETSYKIPEVRAGPAA